MVEKNIVRLLQYTFLLLAAGNFSFNTMYAQTNAKDFKVQVIILNPGHFHAALVRKSMYTSIDTTVHVYAPKGNELDAHLALINGYNRITILHSLHNI